MSEKNMGIVYTNEKCVGCNRCIVACPVQEANISVWKQGRNRIEVNESKCIHCGRCVSACPHGAREFRDDTDAFLQALKEGKKISLAVSSAFYMTYQDQSLQILGYLKELGVEKIYDISLGADISTWCYVKYLEKHPDASYYSPTCQVILNYIEKERPQYLERLIPVHTPLICLAIYAHKYLKDRNPIAYLSPCVAEWDEIHSNQTGGNVSYNVTYEQLMKRFADVQLKEYYAKPDVAGYAMGGLYSIGGGLKTNLSRYLCTQQTLISVDNIFESSDFLDKWEQSFENGEECPVILDILSCKSGCINGPATGKEECDPVNMIQYWKRICQKVEGQETVKGSMEECWKRLEQYFSNVEWKDFIRSFEEKYQQPYIIPEDTYNEIFNLMHKDTEKSRHIDCGYCGYPSCRDMVYAIATGYNKKQNCIQYIQEENRRLYLTDSLTGIANSEAFYISARKLIQDNPEITYVIGVINVRKFTVINELFGYTTGKNVLCFLAEHIAGLYQNNLICARLYSDNFAVCFPYSKENVERLIMELKEICNEYELEFPVSLNVGFCIADDAGEPVNLILDHAIMALTLVLKSNRVDYAFYDKSMRLRMLREAEITSDMQHALLHKQFCIYLQPQFNHSTGQLTGCEALVRWIHPDKGMISPADFIPVFEKTGFITQLDQYVWEEACLVIADWKRRGRRVIPISVNISRIDIMELDLISTLKNLMDKHHITPDELRLEITESAYVEQGNEILDVVAHLRQEKFIVEMDDFGSGYSSLNTLKDVPVDVLKLDLRFLSSDQNVRGNIILESVIDMAKRLDLSVVAEGVETKPQADFLNNLGCETIQGYLYSRPIPVADFEKMVDRIGNRPLPI